jgi:hypothetical protein
MSHDASPETPKAGWPTILAATGSPLKVFALTVLVCNSFFGVAAAWMDDLEAFTSSIHMFLAIVAAFVLTALWSPRSLYHPQRAARAQTFLSGRRRRTGDLPAGASVGADPGDRRLRTGLRRLSTDPRLALRPAGGLDRIPYLGDFPNYGRNR